MVGCGHTTNNELAPALNKFEISPVLRVVLKPKHPPPEDAETDDRQRPEESACAQDACISFQHSEFPQPG